MSARWVALAIVVILGIAVLTWRNAATGVTMEHTDGRRTWIIEAGEEITLSADKVRSDDQFRCQGNDALVDRVPGPGHRRAREGVTGVIDVRTDMDGDVTIDCQPGAVFP